MRFDVFLPLLTSVPPGLIPEDGSLVDEVELALLGHALSGAYRRAAEVVGLLRRDGWDVNYMKHYLWCSHDRITTREQADESLAALGIDLGWLEYPTDECHPGANDGRSISAIVPCMGQGS